MKMNSDYIAARRITGGGRLQKTAAAISSPPGKEHQSTCFHFRAIPADLL